MTVRSITLALGMFASAGMVCLSGCTGEATTTVTEASDHDGHDHDDHDHDGHDHDGHDHDGHDHDGDGHADHDAADHDAAHEGHDHSGHDHGDHSHDFKTLGDAVTEIASLRDTIRDGFKAGDVDAAHDPLHHIGDVLGAVEKMMGSSEIPAAKKDSVMEAVEMLFDGFGAVDEGLHGDGGKKYSDVSDSIDKAIEMLQKEAK